MVSTDPPQRISWGAVDLGPYIDGSYQPPEPKLFTRTDGVGLLYPGLTHSIAGEPESGKSLVIQHAVARLVSQRRPVLYLDFESDPGAVVERLRRFGVGTPELKQWLVYVSPDSDPYKASENRAAEVDAWHHWLTQSWDLVVIDGVTEALSVYGKSSLDNDEVTAWVRMFPRRFEQTGAAVVLIDHLTKSHEGRGRFAIGAQAKLATVTGAAYLVEPRGPLGRGRKGSIEIRLSKDRPGYLRAKCGPWRKSDRTQLAAVVEFDSESGVHTDVTVSPPDLGPDEHKPFRPSQIMENISRELEKSTEPKSLSQIERLVTGKTDPIRKAVELLVDEGYVLRTLGARNAKNHQSAKPYRQSTDPHSDRYDPAALIHV